MATVNAGNHYATLADRMAASRPFWGRKVFTRTVRFTDSCRYELPSPDNQDWNKLFGACFGMDVHYNSARFGWRYNKETDKIELAYYCYLNGTLKSGLLPVAAVIGSDFGLSINVTPSHYYFWINGITSFAVQRPAVPSYGVELGLFFGGNNPAPHDIVVDINRV